MISLYRLKSATLKVRRCVIPKTKNITPQAQDLQILKNYQALRIIAVSEPEKDICIEKVGHQSWSE